VKTCIFLLLASACFGQELRCDLEGYKPLDGLKAESAGGALSVSWRGERGDQLRASFALRNGQPVIGELAVHKNGGAWITLARNLTPEFEVTSGKRRLSEQQMAPLRQLGIALTPDVIEREKWNAFWDAPLMVPGKPKSNLDLPRTPEEIRRAWATYHATTCQVKTDGARLEVSFDGLSLGIFSGRLQYTVYRDSNLLRQEAIAQTSEPSAAYKYVAGVKGLPVNPTTRIAWRDTSRTWQQYRFGGSINQDPVALRARNRLEIVETGGGSVAFLPPSHKFFFAREIETNLGYVYYRKDSDSSFAAGVRQADREEPYRPFGISTAEWDKTVREARNDTDNFALYNAPPGTWQRMPVYMYLSAADARATADQVLAYTHDDRYQEVPGFKVLVSHFHMHWNEHVTDEGTLDKEPSWLQVFRGLGIDMAILADFHSDSHPTDPGPLRFAEQKVYFDACERFSDRDFLLIPGEEPNDTFGGHYITFMPRPVYWSHVRTEGQQFQQNDSNYGKVYHVGNAGEELDMIRREGGLMWQAHPRTKGSTGYPDAVRDAAHYLSDRFLGGSFQSLPVDQSQKRICEQRCLGLLDEMNNWGPGAKYMIAEGDTYMKYPDDETFPQLIVNYVRMPRVPAFKEDWTPLVKALRAGDYFVSTGEVLLRKWSIEGTGARRTFAADVDWTWPPEFVELVWGDGKTANRQVLSATDLAAFANHSYRIPFETAGKKWVRFAAWDSAGNGAFTQPVWLQ
jgi:hypothetical protein